MTSTRSTATDVGRHALWNIAQFGAGKLVTFVSTMVLARLLAPEAFGLVAMALLAINVFDRLKDLGVGSALVQSPESFRRIAPTGATLTAGTSVGLGVLCVVFAPQFADLLGDGRLTPIVRALALSLVVSGLSVLPDSALRRRLRFRERTVPELGGTVVKAVVSIGLALLGVGVWSLVWGQVAASVLTTIVYWVLFLRTRPGRVLGWSTATAGGLLRYGTSISGIALLALVLDNIDYFVVGRRLGATELGYYTMAFRLPELLVVNVCVVIGQVLFSSFSRLQEDQSSLRRQYLEAAGVVAMITVPLGFGLAAAAPAVINVVLGAQFAPAIPLLECLGVSAACYSLSFHVGEVYKATGRTGLMLWLSVARLACFAPVLWIAGGHSTFAVAAAFMALQILFAVVRLTLAHHVLRLGVRAQLYAMAAPLIAGGVMAAGVIATGWLLGSSSSSLVHLAVQVPVGIVVYTAMMALLDRPRLKRCLLTVRGLMAGAS